MKKLLTILRLHFENKLSEREISIITNVSKTTVHNYLALFKSSKLSWPLEKQYLDEDALSKKLNPECKLTSENHLDFAAIHHELKKHKKLTLQLLWEEYHQSGEIQYSYGHLALLYRKWLSKQPEYMRQAHKAGEKVFVDYSGDTIPIYNEKTGEVKQAQIFVAVLGASNYIYLEATHSQKLCDWTMSHVRMFEHFGGVPELVIIDNLRSGVTKAHRYDPDITPAYCQMLSHYGTAAMPARVSTPKDKAKAENGVLIIQRWILARLRHVKFTSLHELNQKLAELMQIANAKLMKLYRCSRIELFNQLDKPVLKELPVHRYIYREYRKARVGGDYHVGLDSHYYSVPYNLVKEEIDIWFTANIVECYYKNVCIAKHVRSHDIGCKTTNIEHMPIGHRKYQEISPDQLSDIANEIGIATGLIIEHIILSAPHKEIGCRKGFGFLNLAKKYGNQHLENVCNYAVNMGIFNYKNIAALLKSNVVANDVTTLHHGNIRGSRYYH